jgi:hypothetical protein
MSENIDINIGVIKEEVSINAANNLIQVNINSAPISIINPQNYDLSQFTNTSPNPFVQQSALGNYVPTSRTLTINGTTQDLSANRTFTIPTNLTIGTTPISSGTIGRVLFEGTGNVLQQSANLTYSSASNLATIAGINLTTNVSGSFIVVNEEISIQSTSLTRRIDLLQSSNVRLRVAGTTGNVLINTTTDAGYKLDVNGTARVQGQLTTTGNVVLLNNGIYKFGPQAGLYATIDNGLTSNSGAGSLFLGYYSAGDTAYGGTTVTLGRLSNVSLSAASGLQEMVRVTGNFAPTSGTALFNALQLTNTINQTGGANGITRGLFVNPTLTSAADFRAIETTAGNVLFGSNFFWDNTNGRLGIGTNVIDAKLQIAEIGSGNMFVAIQKSDTTTGNSVNLDFIVAPSYVPSVTNYGGRLRYTRSGSNGVGNWDIMSSDSTGAPISRFRIFNSGNILIQNGGTFTDAGFRLDVNGSARFGATTVRAPGALSTDIAFRVRNSTDTRDFLVVNGAGDVFNNGAQGVTTNTMYGENAGRNASGVQNVLIGLEAGRNLTTGGLNVFIGHNAGTNNTIGNQNVYVGRSAGLNSTTATNNTFIGVNAGFNNTTGGNNMFLGTNAGLSNTTGISNTAIGFDAGRFIADGVGLNQMGSNSMFIGYDTRAQANNQTNQIVIGHTAIGAGSNTVTLGNTSIIKTILRGTLNAANLPTSATGLVAGDIWNDAGTLKIV